MTDHPHNAAHDAAMPANPASGKPADGVGRVLIAVLQGRQGAVARLRRVLFEVLESGHDDHLAGRVINGVLVALILLNVAAFVAETVPWIEQRYSIWFRWFELFSVSVFTIEYAVRLWIAVEITYLRRMPRWKARALAMRRPLMIIDLLAIAPFFLSQFMMLDLRVVRILRLVRFFKLSRYSPAMHTLMRVISNERRSLSAAGLLLFAAVLISATGMYHIEGRVQPERFGTVPDAAYWAITTLTTVGYGDVLPSTPLGRLWAGITMVAGICILALPVAILSAGFAQEVGRRDFVVTWSLMSRIPLLAEMEAHEASQVMPLLHAHNFPPRAEVLKADQEGAAMYFVASGHVQLRDDGRVEDFRAGDFFGARAMLTGEGHSGTFWTVSKARLLKLYREDFQHLERANPAIGAHIRQVAQKRGRAGVA
jgi:voltage-gated potassium channel